MIPIALGYLIISQENNKKMYNIELKIITDENRYKFNNKIKD